MILLSLERNTVESISEVHNTTAADVYLSILTSMQINAVETIAIDMNAAYVRGAKANLQLTEVNLTNKQKGIFNEALSNLHGLMLPLASANDYRNSAQCRPHAEGRRLRDGRRA